MRLLMGFGDLVRALRVSRNLTQLELATAADVPLSRLLKLEAGCRPTDDQVDRIASALGVPRDALMGDAPIEMVARNPFSTVEAFALSV